MGNRDNRFKFLKKIKNKINKLSEKFDKFSDIKTNDSKENINKYSVDEETNFNKTKNNKFNNKNIDERYDKYIYDQESYSYNDSEENLKGSGKLNKNSNDESDLMNFKDFLNLNNLKNRIFDINPKNKGHFGIAIFCLIILVLGAFSFYFLIYQPYQDELNESKTAKLNELNSFYKGSLSINSNAFHLKNQIEDETDLNKIKNIDVLRTATGDWREFHLGKISSLKDDFGRVMLNYPSDDSKNILLDESEAKSFVNENDAKVLSDVNFKKVDTVVVPISVTRLQASAGLISVGDIVDIYSLESNKSYYSSELANSNNGEISNNTNVNSSTNDAENTGGTNANESMNNSNNSSNLNNNAIPVSSSALNNSSENLSKYPDIKGATVVAILRSKDSGIVDGKYSNSNNLIFGNETKTSENSSSFSTDVEELLKSSITGGYDEKYMSSLLNHYGLKLANYERASNLAELDCQYILLLEVPRTDVNFLINNMDNLILTIPMGDAPDWIVKELLNVYSNQSIKNSSNSTNN